MFALLFLLSHWSLLDLREIPADKTCTSLPQVWSVPRGDRIESEPVMKCNFAQASTDQVGKRKRPPVSCKLYDARSRKIKKMGWKPETVLNLCSRLANTERPPPFSYLLSDQEASSIINTVMGNVPLGSYLGYQLFDKKKSQTIFNVDRPVEKMVVNTDSRIQPFPDLPLPNSNDTFTPPILDQPQIDILKNVTTDLAKSHEIEMKTVRQSLEPEWMVQRSMRLTASNFGKVTKRKRPPTEAFLRNIFIPKDLSNVSSIRHGRQQELTTRSLYSRKMQKKCKKFIVYDAGLVINPSFPYLGASPDGKVYDPTEKDPFGLMEIKNPYTWRNYTMEEACADSNFFLHMVDGKPKLKENDKSGYYDQVQGQLAITGLPWCDFVVHLSGSHSVNVQRIYFNQRYWEENLFPKLKIFYFDHALPFLAKLHV